MKPGTTSIDSGTTQEPLGNHRGTGGVQAPYGPFRGRGPEPVREPVALSVIRRQSRKDTDDRNTACRVYLERVAAGEVQRPRRVRPSAETKAAIALYRVEARKRDRRVAKLIAEAKRQLEREDELRRITHKGGRPRKVVNG